ncbi:MAG: hypothetical protein ACREGE_01500 [Candidatus Microsaccharimonas sp.]
MLHSNPATRPRVTPAAVPNLFEQDFDSGCTYVTPLPNWEADFERLVADFEYIEKSEDTDDITDYQERYIKRRALGISLGKSALALSLTLALPVAAYASDVRTNMAESEHAKPTIRVMNEAYTEDGTDKATIFYHGFNTFGASDLIRTLGDGVSQAYEGEQWSVQYNNAPIDAEKIGTTIKNRIGQSAVNAVDIVSYSMGDVTAVKNGFEIIDSSWTDVESITIMSGPADYDGLTKKTKNELDYAKSLAWIPGIEFSTFGRYVAEMYFYKDDIEKNPTNAIDGINTRFMNGDVTTNNFLASQIYDISDANIKDNFQEIDELKFHPVINYVKIKDGNDDVVDNDYSAEKICEYAEAKGLTCNVFEVESSHGLYWKTSEAYDQVFAEIAKVVKPQVAAEQERLALARADYLNEDTFYPEG